MPPRHSEQGFRNNAGSNDLQALFDGVLNTWSILSAHKMPLMLMPSLNTNTRLMVGLELLVRPT